MFGIIVDTFSEVSLLLWMCASLQPHFTLHPLHSSVTRSSRPRRTWRASALSAGINTSLSSVCLRFTLTFLLQPAFARVRPHWLGLSLPCQARAQHVGVSVLHDAPAQQGQVSLHCARVLCGRHAERPQARDQVVPCQPLSLSHR